MYWNTSIGLVKYSRSHLQNAWPRLGCCGVQGLTNHESDISILFLNMFHSLANKMKLVIPYSKNSISDVQTWICQCCQKMPRREAVFVDSVDAHLLLSSSDQLVTHNLLEFSFITGLSRGGTSVLNSASSDATCSLSLAIWDVHLWYASLPTKVHDQYKLYMTTCYWDTLCTSFYASCALLYLGL